MNMTKANLVLAVAAAVLAVPTWLTIVRDRETFVDIAHAPRMFEGFDPEQVATLILGKPKDVQAPAPTPPGADPNQKPQVQYDMIRFQRTDKGFVLGQGMGNLTGVPVNSQMLDLQAMKHLSEIPADKETLVQPEATDEQLAEYGLDEQHAFVIKAGNAQNQLIAELFVGNDSSGGQKGTEAVRGVFVRRADSRDVVLYEVPYWNRQVQVDPWVDRTVLKVPGDKVRKITIKNESGEVAFVRPAGQASWEAESAPEGKGAVRQIEVEGLVQRFGYLQANEYLGDLQSADLPAMGLQQPKVEVTVTYEADDKETAATLQLGNPLEGKNETYLRSSTSNFVMGLASHFVTPFERAIGEFFDPAAPVPGQPPPGDDRDKDGDNKDGDKAADNSADKEPDQQPVAPQAPKPGAGDAAKPGGTGDEPPAKPGPDGTKPKDGDGPGKGGSTVPGNGTDEPPAPAQPAPAPKPADRNGTSPKDGDHESGTGGQPA